MDMPVSEKRISTSSVRARRLVQRPPVQSGSLLPHSSQALSAEASRVRGRDELRTAGRAVGLPGRLPWQPGRRRAGEHLVAQGRRQRIRSGATTPSRAMFRPADSLFANTLDSINAILQVIHLLHEPYAVVPRPSPRTSGSRPPRMGGEQGKCFRIIDAQIANDVGERRIRVMIIDACSQRV